MALRRSHAPGAGPGVQRAGRADGGRPGPGTAGLVRRDDDEAAGPHPGLGVRHHSEETTSDRSALRANSPGNVSAGLTPAGVLGLQRNAGNRAVAELVHSGPNTRLRPGMRRTPALQRVGGWSDADTRAGAGLTPGEPKTGWNVGEHAVGGIRRIPIDGLVSGLQEAAGSDGGKSLTTEEVAGTVAGPARSDVAEQAGRGRAIALVPKLIKPDQSVDVLFHLHGNTENADRGFAGWRQHKQSGKVRDVERDRIAQQMEAAGSPQLVGILPMGLNQSQFGAISPDSYIRDAFDRLAELGAWPAAPKNFRVVLSAHSGGGFTVERMLKGRKGYQLPANLGMIVLFEANNSTKGLKPGQVPAFQTWAISQLDAHLAYLTSSSHTDADKTKYLAGATRLRAYFDPRKGHSYGATYRPIRDAVAAWLAANGAKLGTYLPEVRGLIQVVEQEVGHEGQMRAGLGNALADLPAAGSGSGGTPGSRTTTPPAPGGTSVPAPSTGGSSSAGSPTGQPVAATATTTLAERAAVITPAMVGAQSKAAPDITHMAFAAAVALGMSKLPAAAAVLSRTGVRGEIDLTDALFALVRPELGGGRIPADREDLKREWRKLRSGYVRPVLASGALKAARGSGEGPGPTGAPKTTPAVPTKPPAPEPGSEASTTPTPAVDGTPEEEYESFKDEVKKAFGKSGVKRYLAVRELYSTRSETAGNPAGWLNALQFGAEFAGTKLNGVHPKLTAALAKVDAEVTRQTAAVRAAGGLVVFQGDFQPRAVTGKPDKLSDHALGLALHLNYKNNPYVGRNEAASQLIARIAEEAGQEKFWNSVRGQGRKTSQEKVEEIYTSWAAASDAVAKYFTEMKAMEVKDKAGELDADQKAELKKRRKEYENLRDTDLAKHRDPANGVFMHTTGVEGDPMLQIIKQLTGEAGLEWGGTYGSRPKDLHHFALKL